jgi:hypothetical protein
MTATNATRMAHSTDDALGDPQEHVFQVTGFLVKG